MTETIKIETVVSDNFTMDYFRFGHGKDVLVILPGLSVQSVMGAAEAVAEAYQTLTDDYTIYLFDRRKELPETYSVKQMAQDTAEALRITGLNRVNFFGASQGGMIAMEIAANHPELVKKLVLGSTTSRVTDEQYQTIAKWIQLAEHGEAEKLYLDFGQTIYPKNTFEQAKEMLIDAAKTVTDEDLNRFVILAKGLKDFDVTKDLEKVVCPVLLLESKDDQLLGPDAGPEVEKHLNGHTEFELYLYEGYGHAAYDTAPDYKERILRFLID